MLYCIMGVIFFPMMIKVPSLYSFVKVVFSILNIYIDLKTFVLKNLKNVYWKSFQKKRSRLATYIQESNLIEPDRKKLLKCKTILIHCRRHDTIMIFFLFEVFHEQNIHLLSRNYLDNNGRMFFM